MSRGARRGRRRRDRGPADAALPLEGLEASLAPVRRSLAFIARSGERPAYVGAIAERHLLRAEGLDLPDALASRVRELRQLSEGLDQASDAEFEVRSAAMYAELHRLDALAGLPLRRKLTAVARGPLVVEEPPPAPSPTTDASTPPQAKHPKGRKGDAKRRAPSDESEEAPRRPASSWDGSLGEPLAEVLPGDTSGRTVGDVLSRAPEASHVVAPVHGAGRPLPDGQRVAVGGRVRRPVTTCRADGTREASIQLVGAGPLTVVWRAESPPHRSLLPVGERVVLVGRVEGETLVDAEVADADGNSVALPHYGTDDDRGLREAWQRLRPQLGQLSDPLHGSVLRRRGLLTRAEAFEALHQGRAAKARRRLAFDEALSVSLAAALPRYTAEGSRGVGHQLLHGFMGQVEQRLDIVLDDNRQSVLEDIKRDLRRGAPSRRVLTGEVGAGKGLLALLAAAMVAEGKGQVLFLGPDAAEVDERFAHSEQMLRDGGLVARRLPDEPSRAACDAVKRGEIHVVFGTHALLRADLPFRRLGLVVSVERFPFGEAGHALRALPAPKPDLLVIAQVPVGPRVLSTAYADFDVSVVVDEDRCPARIEVCRADRRDAAYDTLVAAAARGEQGVVLFPRVKGGDALDLAQGHAVVRALQAEALEGLRVALLHGAQSVDERRATFADFQHRRIDVLVATVTLEDGPTAPGLSTVVVEQADRMEQWRLHRVIGSLSTALRQAVATLVVGEHADADAEARIQRVLDAENGYDLTERRVTARGLEACVVDEVPPLPTTRWLDLPRDLDLVLAARDEAHRVLRADPRLRRGSHQQLGAEMLAAWPSLWPEPGDTWAPPTLQGPTGDRRRRRRRRRRR